MSQLLLMSTKDGLYWPFGLDIFDARLVVAVFVVAAILHVFVGRSLGLSWLKSIGVSAVANCLWFVLLFGFCLPFRFGGSATPNPTLFAIEQLTHLSILTTVVMGVVWLRVARPKGFVRVLLPLAAVQAAWIPLSLAILMSPSEPLQRLEQVVNLRRAMQLHTATSKHIGALPLFSSATEFTRAFGVPGAERGARFPRWATRDEGGVLLEVNAKLSNYKPKGTERYMWIWRHPAGRPWQRERHVDLSSGRFAPSWIVEPPDDVPMKRVFDAAKADYRPSYKPYPSAQVEWVEAGGSKSSAHGHSSSGNGGVIETYLYGQVGFEDGSVSRIDVLIVASDLLGRVASVDLKPPRNSAIRRHRPNFAS